MQGYELDFQHDRWPEIVYSDLTYFIKEPFHIFKTSREIRGQLYFAENAEWHCSIEKIIVIVLPYLFIVSYAYIHVDYINVIEFVHIFIFITAYIVFGLYFFVKIKFESDQH